MSWLELHITTDADHANMLSSELLLFGAQAITLQDGGDQPIYEPSPDQISLWQKTVVIGLFDQHQPMHGILAYLEQKQALGELKHFHLKQLADQDWVRLCLDSFKPLSFGKRLWICPSWQTPPDPHAVNVILDPGLAFGTGTHPTTRLCLEWLDEEMQAAKIVIDYGCGSGILALAALKLGAEQVLAIDNDPQALQATKHNGEINHFTSPKLAIYLPDQVKSASADLLIANILALPLIKLAPLFASLVKKQGKILLSGILNYQVPGILDAYKPWFLMENPVFSGEWSRLSGFRK